MPAAADLVERGLHQAQAHLLDWQPAERLREHRIGASGGQVQQTFEQSVPPRLEGRSLGDSCQRLTSQRVVA